MPPENNNVYGIITAPQGLQPVLQAVAPMVGPGKASIYTSKYGGAETLRLCTASVDFESECLDSAGQHLFGGSVGGSLDEVLRFVRDLSDVLTHSGIKHSFEIYADQHLVQRIPSEPHV